MNYYISDLHIDHKNVLVFDGRPFTSIEENNAEIMRRWNDRVGADDTVYLLGDEHCGKADAVYEYMRKLNGHKVLIRGNHTLKQLPSKLKGLYDDIKDYKEIVDSGIRAIMCHYPIPFYKCSYSRDTVMLYGHLHNTAEQDFIEDFKEYVWAHDTRGRSKALMQLYNVGCMMPWMNYTPKTLSEIISGYEKWQKDRSLVVSK